MNYTGRVALVTGAGRGLGRAFAQGLAAQGMAVAVTSRTQAELDETVALIMQAGGHALALAGDVTDPQSVKQIVADVVQQLGPIDVLINNAGIFRALGAIVEIEPDDWWREMEVNVRGTFLFARAVASGMMARKRGRIINIASGAGTVAIPGASAYCVSKAAVIRLTEQMALELSDYNIAVLAYHPGTVRTPMNDHVLSLPQTARYAPWFIQLFEENRDVPIEVATSTLLAMASGAADDLSGSFIDVNDDLPALVLRREEVQRESLRVLRMKF